MPTVEALPVFLFREVLEKMVRRFIARVIGMELRIIVTLGSREFDLVAIVEDELLLAGFKNWGDEFFLGSRCHLLLFPIFHF